MLLAGLQNQQSMLAAMQEVSFQYFRNELLARGLVDKLEVLNKNTARVYVRTSGSGVGGGMAGQTDGGMQPTASGNPAGQSQYKYYFNIGSIDSFERKMEEAQQSFGMGLGEEVGPSTSIPCICSHLLHL
jgi:AFG3 family protein